MLFDIDEFRATVLPRVCHTYALGIKWCRAINQSNALHTALHDSSQARLLAFRNPHHPGVWPVS